MLTLDDRASAHLHHLTFVCSGTDKLEVFLEWKLASGKPCAATRIGGAQCVLGDRYRPRVNSACVEYVRVHVSGEGKTAVAYVHPDNAALPPATKSAEAESEEEEEDEGTLKPPRPIHSKKYDRLRTRGRKMVRAQGPAADARAELS